MTNSRQLVNFLCLSLFGVFLWLERENNNKKKEQLMDPWIEVWNCEVEFKAGVSGWDWR